jgi:Na+:H+ antiporter, NhaA family
MSDPTSVRGDLHRLPREPVDRLFRPFTRFVRIEAAGGAVLLACAIAALVLSNSRWADSFENIWQLRASLAIGPLEFDRSIREWINDALMTLFFFLVSLELKRELVLGELKSARMAAFSIAAAVGGMLVPAGLYLTLQVGQAGAGGWGTVMATDTAFALGCLALLGERIPQSLRVFMLSMAVIDDLGAVIVVALGYGHELSWGAVALAALGVVGIRVMALLGVRSIPLYFFIGAAVWLTVDASGIHATITGVILGLMTPARRWVSDERLYAILDRVIAHPADDTAGSGDTRDRRTLQLAEIAARETLSPVERLEMIFHPWVGFLVMPLFALANAGVSLSLSDITDPVSVAVFLGFALGKPIGVLSFTWVAVRLGIATRPDDLSWGLVAGAALLAGIGFTMALFIANLAFSEDLIGSAKLGIFLASSFSALAGLLVLACLTRGESCRV